MSFSTTANRNDYIGNGSLTVYDYTFKILAATNLKVTIQDLSGINLEQVYPTDYTVSGVGNANGGSVTLTTALPLNHKLAIVRWLPLLQETDIRNQGGYFPDTIEDQLDRFGHEILQLQDQLNRAVLIPIAEVSTSNAPSLINRKNKVFMWGASGEPAVADLSAETVTFSPQAQVLSGDGSTTDYPLLMAPGSDAALVVAVSGTPQKPGVDFTVTGSTISFTSAPPNAMNNILIQNFGFAMGVSGTVADGTVTTAKIVDNAVTTSKIPDEAITTEKLENYAATTLKILDEAVTYEKIQNVTTGRILGRTTAGPGSVEELSVDGSLTLAGGTLSGTAASTSQAGVVELATTAEVQTGTDATRAPSVSTLRSGLIVAGSATSVGGLTAVDYTSIPSWVKRIIVLFHSFKPGGTSAPLLQVGGSGGIETSSYLGATIDNGAGELLSSGFLLGRTAVHNANSMYHGSVVLENLNTTTWVVRGALSRSNTATGPVISGSHDVTTVLDRLRITTVGGTDVFASGLINIHYE